MDNKELNPRAYSAARRSLPFRHSSRTGTTVSWETVSGLVAVCQGEMFYVMPKMLYGVVKDDNGYSIAVYWVKTNWDSYSRPYTLKTLRSYAIQGKIVEVKRGLKYEQMKEQVQKEFPFAAVPSKETFYGQFGLTIEDIYY